MKIIVLILGLIVSSIGLTQKYEFKTVIDIDATDVKSQDQTGTCWSYSTTSFIESELIRMDKGNHDISEMYNARMVYPDKAMKYVRYHGKYQFSEGSLAHDVINTIRNHGLIPQEAYSGMVNGEDRHNHSELVSMLTAVVNVALKSRTVGSTWIKAFNAILDSYLGAIPESFKYKGKEYTPKSFASSLGINADDYVSITSFNHHEFDSWFILEVPDNFSQGSFYNVKLDEFQQVVNDALKNGYTIAWDVDVSEKSFSRKGIAVWPETPYYEMSEDDQAKVCVEILPELIVNQENRQVGFEDHTTTDDHLMHITGTLKDQNGNLFYKVKNSWGDSRGIDGYIYASESFFRMKSISILLHKDALSSDLKKRMKK